MTASRDGQADASGDPAKKLASDHLVRGVDFLFALTLGQGILLFRDFWTDPFDPDYLTVALALAAIYFTTIQSFIDWHLAMERDPYQVEWEQPAWPRTLERIRFTVDFLIVTTYAFIVVNAVPLIKDPDASIDVYLAGFPAIFALYLVWVILRRRRYPRAAAAGPMAVFLCAFGALYVAYRLDLLGGGAEANNLSLVLVLSLTLLYRVSNAVGRFRST